MRERCKRERCKWKVAILILIVVGLLKEFRPSGPFLVDYAVDHKELSTEQMTHEVLPATTASFIITLVFLLMVTDVLCYKPIIVLGGLATVATWVVTIWFYHGVEWARVRQVFYGISAIATEVAYFTYMYANIEKSDYKKVTSYTHSAVHFGQFLSGLVGQLCISLSILDFEQLNYLSLGGAIGSLAFSLLLPRTLRELETEEAQGGEGHPDEQADDPEAPMNKSSPNPELEKNPSPPESPTPSPQPPPPKGLNYTRNVGVARKEQPGFLQRWKEAPGNAWESLKYAYTDPGIIKWSVWWAMAYGLYIQVDLYAESLWKEIEHHSHQNVYNGAVHASHSIISVVLGLYIGRTKTCWIKWGCTVFALGTLLQGAALFTMSQTHDLYICYGAFILFQTLFQVLVIISKSLVAESIREGSEAFIFGMNSLAACVIHLALTLAVTGRHGFRLPIQNQYIVYGVYSILLGTGFYFSDILRKCAGRTRTWSVEMRESVARRQQRVRDEEAKAKDGDKEKEVDKDANVYPAMPYSIPREH